jgi:hypothetical protein
MFRCGDSIARHPFWWAASSVRLLLPVDRFQGTYHRVNLITLFAKVRKNLLDIHTHL